MINKINTEEGKVSEERKVYEVKKEEGKVRCERFKKKEGSRSGV